MKLRKAGRRSAFTLIELLVVMVIIGILSGLIFTSIAAVTKKARMAKAKVQLKQLEKAFVAYHDEYGDWPSPLIGYDIEGAGLEAKHTGIQFGKNAALLLRGENIDDLNPQEIKFFDISDNEIRVDNDGTEGFVDPWNYCYKYMMDFNDDGNLMIRFTSGISTNEVKGLGVAIWSQGPDGDDQYGADNITSWKLQ